MAKAIVCDRCGIDSEKLKGYSHFVEIKAFRYDGLNDVANDCKLSMDLCERCLKDVTDLIQNKIESAD